MAVTGINNTNPYWRNNAYAQNPKVQQGTKAAQPAVNQRRDTYFFFEEEETKTEAADTATLDYFKNKGCDYEVTTGKDGDSLQKILDLLRSHRGKSFIVIDPKFYKRLSEDPELAEKYAGEIENMIKADKQFEQQAKKTPPKTCRPSLP